MIDLDLLLADAGLPERVVPICVNKKLNSALDAAKQAYAAAVDEDAPADTRLGQMPAVHKASQDLEAARAAVREAAAPFLLRGLSRPEWTSLLVAHPPRDDDKRDQIIGFNTETFPSALVRACLVDPKPSDAQWERLQDSLNFGQFDLLAATAMQLSRDSEDIVPFSSVGSVPTGASVKKSPPRAR